MGAGGNFIGEKLSRKRVFRMDIFPTFKFSNRTLDGLQLISCADAVISGGGSMNREAACLRIP